MIKKSTHATVPLTYSWGGGVCGRLGGGGGVAAEDIGDRK